MYLLTLVSPISIPILSSSPWIFGAPQIGLSRLMVRISSRIPFGTVGRAGLPRRIFQVQNRRKPFRCRPMTVEPFAMWMPNLQSVTRNRAKPKQ
jgi:hypothetical protein